MTNRQFSHRPELLYDFLRPRLVSRTVQRLRRIQITVRLHSLARQPEVFEGTLTLPKAGAMAIVATTREKKQVLQAHRDLKTHTLF